MPERSDIDRLNDILDEADLMAETLKAVSLEAFQRDAVLQRAVLHMLQTIGEAASQLSDAAQASVPDAPWRPIRGMRNRIVHGYIGLDLGAVWRTATEDAPALAVAIRKVYGN